VLSTVAVACSHPAPPAQPQVPAGPPPKVRLAVLPPQDKPFGKAAKAIGDAFAAAHVAGVDETKVWKSPIDVVQLQVECDDPTPDCYAAAGKELKADRLLFATIEAAPKKQVDVTVTLFDVATKAVKQTAHQVYANEADAAAGAAALVTEATK